MAEQILVIFKNISELNGYERNTRTHSEEQIEQIAASIQEYGWTNPVLIDEDGVIIAGHGRCAAAELLALEQVPTITLTGLTDKQKRAYRIADNRLPLNAGWDESLLRIELSDLMDEGYDLSLLGFDEIELDGLLADDGIPIAFDKDEGQTGADDMNWLTFNRKRVPMTDDESNCLMAAFDAFVEKSGSHFGFVAYLTGGNDAHA